MAITYAPNTKKVVEVYSEAIDQWGIKVVRRMGWNKVYYCDDATGAMSLGPYIEPVSDRFSGSEIESPDLPTDVIGRQFVGDSHQETFWKSLSV